MLGGHIPPINTAGKREIMKTNSEKLEMFHPHLQTSIVTFDILKVIPCSVIGGNLMDKQQELIAWRPSGSQQSP